MLHNVHNAHYAVKSKRTLMPCIMHVMFDDRPDEAKRLEQARVARGFPTAKEAAEFFGWNYDTYAQHENGTRGITRAVTRYAKAFRVDPSWLQYNNGRGPTDQVPLKGYVGAGQAVIAVDDGNESIDAPAELRPDTVAAIVRGDSMLPAFRDGWIIYWSRQLPPGDMLNQLCVVQLENDEIYIKILRHGSAHNLWTLQSINATVSDKEDVVVRWASPIDWIRPR